VTKQQNIPTTTGRKDGLPQVGITPGALSAAQRKFVHEFVETTNASEAARRAGYSPRTAGVQGAVLLKNPRIQQAIDDLVAERAAVTRSLLIEELAAVALSNAQDFFSWDQQEDVVEILDDGTTVIRQRAAVQLRPSKELTRRQLAAVKTISEKTSEGGARKVEIALHDKLKAVELLGRALGLFPRDSETVINLNTQPVSSVSVSYADDPAEARTIDGEAHDVTDNDR